MHGPQKQQLVQARLGKRLRAGDFKSYRAYYEYVRRDSQAVVAALRPSASPPPPF